MEGNFLNMNGGWGGGHWTSVSPPLLRGISGEIGALEEDR